METNKVEYSRFNVIETQHGDFIEFEKTTIGILPYKIVGGVLTELALSDELIDTRKNGSITLITTELTADDSDLLTCAAKCLKNNYNTEVANSDSWQFLGSLKVSKQTSEQVHVYAVNVSDIDLSNTKLKFMAANDAITINESLILASFIRLFNTYYIANK